MRNVTMALIMAMVPTAMAPIWKRSPFSRFASRKRKTTVTTSINVTARASLPTSNEESLDTGEDLLEDSLVLVASGRVP